MKFSLWLIPVLIAFTSAPQAAENRWVVTDAQSFDAAAAQLRTQLSSGRFAYLSSEDKQSIDADMTRMQALLTRYGSVRSLNRVHAVRYFNAQEHLNGLLFGDLAQRNHCDYFATDGIVTCTTYGGPSRLGLSVPATGTEQGPISTLGGPHMQAPQRGS